MKGISATPTFEGFVGMTQHVLTNARQQHWKTKVDAVHRALGEFYDAASDSLDTLVEAYQGREGIIDVPEVPFHKESDPIMMIRTLRRYIDENRDMLCHYREIQNLLDEFLAKIDKTLYRLENLS
jgi:hypothetical protein